MRDLLRVLFRITAVTLIEALALVVTSRLLAGLTISGTTAEQLQTAVYVAIILSLLNPLIRPLIVLVGLAINLYTVGLFVLVLNTGILIMAAFFLPHFDVANAATALIGALILAVVNTFITGLISVDQDYAYFDGVVSWLDRRNIGPGSHSQSRGLVILEIDGLSYARVQRALADGRLATMKRLLDAGSHRLSHMDCGLPSQSSSCQAGIMYGHNDDIPGFRWYVKEKSRLIVSNNMLDAAEINQGLFNGNGLLRGGTSVNNLLSGEAARSLMTISTLRDNAGKDAPHSGYDLTLVFLNPYLFSRAIVLTIWDLILEFYQAVRQRLRNVQPRVNRLNRFYPFLRAGLNVFIRDVGTNAVILDIMRGSPAIYMTFMGYDEIAHHAGPDSPDALNSLRGFDRSMSRILDVISRKAPRPYDLFVLSDHGQSGGATFYQRSGYTLGTLLQNIVSGKSFVPELSDAANVRAQVSAVLSEMEGLRGLSGEGQARAGVLSRAGRNLGKRVQAADEPVPPDAELLVLAGGNLANVYFPQMPGKATVAELEARHPELLERLVAHPHIGLVVAHMENGQAWAIGKTGARNLGDGTTTGKEDPLECYGNPQLRAEQLRRLADFAHVGDLIVISAVYENDEVAAFEDLIGSHGGMGGEQTDAFILHPADLEVPTITNMTELHPVLNGRRGTLQPTADTPQTAPLLNPWSGPVLLAGMRNFQQIFVRAARSLRLDRDLFVEVAGDPFATGQGLLIMALLILGTLMIPLMSIIWPGLRTSTLVAGVIVLVLGLLLSLLLATLAGRRRGRDNSFVRSFNTISYAAVGGFVTWFAPLDSIGPMLLIAGTLIVLVASWLAIQEALTISRWPAIAIPLLAFGLAVLALLALTAVLGAAPLEIVHNAN